MFAVVEKAGTIVMNDGEELDSWSVLINGHVEVEHSNGETEQLHLGDRFVDSTELFSMHVMKLTQYLCIIIFFFFYYFCLALASCLQWISCITGE